MPGTVTRRFRVHNAEQFHEAFSETASTKMYLYIARVSSWPDDANPPTPTDSIQVTEYDNWKKMLAAKRVQSSDVTFAVPRYNWATGKVYREYDTTSTTLFNDPAGSNTFYAVSSDLNVYKCLFNNKGAQSTVEPTGTSTSTLSTADGYQWKFMYNINAADALKFVTDNFVPIKTLASDDGSAQFDVQSAASNGAIDVIDVRGGGTLYMNNSGTLAAVADGDTMTLAAGANTSDNIYNGSALRLVSGTGSGQVREIVDYNGSTKVVQLKTAFSVVPNTSTTYQVAPLVTIKGDGTGAVAFANVSTASSNAVNQIGMISTGSNYSEATVTISANSSHGSNASAVAYVSPPGGHGSDPVGEFAAHNVILNVQLSGTEGGTFPTVNDFRTVGILRDPKLANGSIASASRFDQTTRLTVASVSGSGAYTLDETIRGNTSGAVGKFVKFANTNAANTAGVIHITDSISNGSFSGSESLKGLTSNITATLSSIVLPGATGLVPFTGDHIYVENRAPISRASDQIEDIKLVVKF
tara:strand:+ start:5902 stop:7482 length:1581 start_codon:yes stop_codon:yes gene_type:complete